MKSQSSNKSFGLLFFIVFLILGLWPLKNADNINFYFILISLIFLILGLINSKILSPLNKSWIKLGEILGKIVSPLVMGFIYFIIITPIGIFMRFIGKDLLNLKLNNDKTYWIKRSNKINTMKRQF